MAFETQAPRVRRLERNEKGLDFAVGDIHGHFTGLQRALQRIGFDPERDRLFSVGDLVDRGPESAHALEWLEKSWFYAIQGNHEDLAVRWGVPANRFSPAYYAKCGGAWMMDLPEPSQQAFAAAFSALPYAIEVETAEGLVGIVHAEVWGYVWPRMVEQLSRVVSNDDLKGITQQTMWARDRFDTNDTEPVVGVRAVVVGHTPVDEVTVLGNVHYIDTGGWAPDGAFTFLNLSTLAATTVRDES
jgi:serine/threonine protein phosphatase 1